MEEEIWKDIKGYEGIYQVSNLGKVRSFSRKYANYGNEIKILKGLNNRGYLRVSLSKNGKCKMFSIHRLVAEAFIPNPNNYSCVNHKDENPSNNNVKNLEWCSINYNCNYGNRNKKIAEKQKNINNKLIKCIETGKIYLSLNECARKMNIKAPNIWASMNNYNRAKTAKGYTFQYIELDEILDERDSLKEELKELNEIMEIGRKREYHSKFLKDFQKERGKNVFPDHDEIYKRYDDYKSRVEKAIDLYENDDYSTLADDMYKILKGVDKE